MKINRIEELARRRGLSLPRLSVEAGLSKNAVEELLKSRGGGRIETWEKLADFLGVSLSYLRGRDEKRPLPDCVLPVVGTVGASVSRTGAWLDEGKTISLSGCKGLKVDDHSMNPVARSGQVVLYRPGDMVKKGDLVVVDLDDGLIFKQYHEVGGVHQFVSLNVTLGLPVITRKKRPEAMWKVVAVVME